MEWDGGIRPTVPGDTARGTAGIIIIPGLIILCITIRGMDPPITADMESDLLIIRDIITITITTTVMNPGTQAHTTGGYPEAQIIILQQMEQSRIAGRQP